MAQQQPIEKRVDLLCFPSVPHHAFPCISVCVCSVYVPVLRYDLLLMTEEAAVGRTAEGKGGGAFQRKQREGRDVLTCWVFCQSVCILQS